MSRALPRVVVSAMPELARPMLEGRIEPLPWEVTRDGVSREVDGLFIYGHPSVDAALLDRLPGLKVISNHGVGVDHIDVAAAAARGIPVGNTPRVLDAAVADLALALLLAGARRLAEGDRYARSAQFTHFDPGFMLGRDFHGSTLGIVGLGSIGMQIARRAAAFDVRVLYHNRRRRNTADEAATGASYVSLDELLTQSDFVVLIVPLTAETRGLIGRRELSLMKPTALLVNIARGPVVDTTALTEALERKQIYGAALDVTEPEPLPRDHPLLKLDNVTILPHLGSATVQTRTRMAELAVENLLLGLAGQPLRCVVSP